MKFDQIPVGGYLYAVETQPPGTEFFVAETAGQKSPRETFIVGRDRDGENKRQNPLIKGHFSIGDGFRGSGRLDGGVVSQIRTRLPLIWPISG